MKVFLLTIFLIFCTSVLYADTYKICSDTIGRCVFVDDYHWTSNRQCVIYVHDGNEYCLCGSFIVKTIK